MLHIVRANNLPVEVCFRDIVRDGKTQLNVITENRYQNIQISTVTNYLVAHYDEACAESLIERIQLL